MLGGAEQVEPNAGDIRQTKAEDQLIYSRLGKAKTKLASQKQN